MQNEMLKRVGVMLSLVVLLAGCQDDPGVEQVSFGSNELARQLPALADLVSGARIVLLGENGHGVREFSQAKVELIEWLHEHHGFNVVVFESGFFECGWAWENIENTEPADALRGCLKYAFEHEALLPLFERFRHLKQSAESLRFAGMDMQAQGFDSRPRPQAVADWLGAIDPALARRVSRADTALFLAPQDGGLGERVYQYAHENVQSLKADYRTAAELTHGWKSWVFRLAEAWVERLAMRGAAEIAGSDERPSAYYELRDEWMARAVAAYADSLGAGNKVIVWLHNDHARYGRFPSASDSIRSTGGFLKEWFGSEVVSIGWFFGRGRIADNSRRPRDVAPLPAGGLEEFLARSPASYLVLRGNENPSVSAWASSAQAYLRMGLDTLRLVPGREFDALIYVDSVSTPTYVIP